MLVLQFIVALIFACFCFVFLHASKFCLINPGGVCLVHVNHLQLAILILLSWVIGYAVYGNQRPAGDTEEEAHWDGRICDH